MHSGRTLWAAASLQILRPTAARYPGRLLHPQQNFDTLAEGLPENQAGRSKRPGQAIWEEGGVERFLDKPDLVLAEGSVLVFGRVPGAAA